MIKKIIKLNIFSGGKLPSYDSIWFIGDDFATKSFEQNFQQRYHGEYNGFSRENYDTIGFMNNEYTSNTKNILSRMRNAFVEAVQKYVLLPKYVVIVCDNDLIKTTKKQITDGSDFEAMMKKCVNYLMVEYRKLVDMQMSYLPKKAKRHAYPTFLWIECPKHVSFKDNDERKVFNDVLQDCAKMHRHTVNLHLKKVWDPEDYNLYIDTADRFTSDGLNRYWAAIDCTIKFADTILMKKLEKIAKKKNQELVPKQHNNNPNMGDNRNQYDFNKRYDYDRYHIDRRAVTWNKDRRPSHTSTEVKREHRREERDITREYHEYREPNGRRKLPTPPPKRKY